MVNEADVCATRMFLCLGFAIRIHRRLLPFYRWTACTDGSHTRPTWEVRTPSWGVRLTRRGGVSSFGRHSNNQVTVVVDFCAFQFPFHNVARFSFGELFNITASISLRRLPRLSNCWPSLFCRLPGTAASGLIATKQQYVSPDTAIQISELIEWRVCWSLVRPSRGIIIRSKGEPRGSPHMCSRQIEGQAKHTFMILWNPK